MPGNGASTWSERHLLAAIVESSQDAIVTKTLGGIISSWNRAAERMFGYAANEAVGQPITLVIPPDRRAEEEGVMARIRQGEGIDNLETVRLTKTGQIIDVALTISPVRDDDGRIIGASKIARDISARKAAEAALQQAAEFPEQNPQPVLRLSRSGEVLYANRGSEPLLKYWGVRTGERVPSAWAERIAAAASGGDIVVSCDDRMFSCLVHAVAGKPYVNLYGRDITDRQQALEALQEARDELETRVVQRTAALTTSVQELKLEIQRRTAAEDQLRRLSLELTRAEQRERQRLARVLHDGLQQLLVAAQLRTGWLARATDPRVQESTQELRNLLQQAIAASRSLTVELSPPELQTSGLRPALDWLARWMAETHQLTVEVRGNADQQPANDAVTTFVFQAVRELLFNIVKHAGVKCATVDVSAADGQLRITVSDAGRGFDPTHVEMSSSNGFGLPSIRQRLEFMGGKLDVDSVPGHGSRFTLLLPLHSVR